MKGLPDLAKILIILLALGLFTAVAITMSQHATALVNQAKRSI